MRITIAAVGRMKAGPEREIAERLMARATAIGRANGVTFASREFSESRASSAESRKSQEAAALLGSLPDRAILVALDENGRSMDSRAFAERIGRWRDDGAADLVFALGGPDGHGQALLDRADLRLAFGSMTWPHQIARLLLAEQLYRALTILTGHPYHRD